MLAMIISIFICLLPGLIVSSITSINKLFELDSNNHECKYDYIPPFIVSDYLSRIDQEHVKILEEREKEPTYIITLWLGLDGLRMNESGALEWVSRAKKKSPPPRLQEEKELPEHYEELHCSDGSVYIVPIPNPTYHYLQTPTYISFPQINQSIMLQHAQIENNMRLFQMLDNQKIRNRIDQINLDRQQQM